MGLALVSSPAAMIRLRALVLAVSTLATSLLLMSCGSGDTVDNSSCQASNGPSSYYPEVSTNDDANIVGQKIPQMPHTHVDPGTKVTYEHNPPTSGCHYNLDKAGKNQFAPIKPGVYTQSVDPEYWVHNLEHGYIVVLYDCGSQGPTGCSADFATIRTWAAQLPVDPGLLQGAQAAAAAQQAFPNPYTKILVVPWSNFGHKFGVVSWDYYLPLDSPDTAQMQKFYDNHVGHGPEGLYSQ
jgi:hypothetical protein